MVTLPWRIVAVLLAFSIAAPTILAQDRKVDAYVFWREGCPHCERAIDYRQSNLDRISR